MFGSFFQICLYFDSAAARGIINRLGVGKVRHLACRSLWPQERMASGSMIVSPVSGLKNPADIGTKRLNAQRTKAVMFLLGMFDSSNNCQVGETEALSILRLQEMKQAMSSLRRLMESDDHSSALQLVMFMNALGLARGDGDNETNISTSDIGYKCWLTYVLQIVTLVACLVAGMVFLARTFARQRDPVAQQGEVVAQQVPVEDEADDVGETESDRWCRYKTCSISERSDPEFWQELNHIELSSSSSEPGVDINPNPGKDGLLEVLEGEHISNRASASWLFGRVNRRLENVTHEADNVIYDEMYHSLSVSLINMTNGTELPPAGRVREIVMAPSNLSFDENPPSASLSVAQMCEEIIQSELHATAPMLQVELFITSTIFP